MVLSIRRDFSLGLESPGKLRTLVNLMRYMINFRIFIFLGLFVSSLQHSSCEGAGLAMHPMEQHVIPTKSAVYIASNQQDKAIAVEVIIERWTITEEGEEKREVTNELVAYPSQFILKGHTFKKIKVGLRHPVHNLDCEKCYRVTIRELPISLEPEPPGTYRIYQASAYRTSYYLQPRSGQPNLELIEIKFHNSILTTRFRNSGTIHCHLRNPELILTTRSGQRIKIDDEEVLKSINGENMHAKITRIFHFDLAQIELPQDIVGGSLQFKDQGFLENKTFQLNW